MLSALQDTNPKVKQVSHFLATSYAQNVKPLEKAYMYGELYDKSYKEAEFTARPMILTLGQYSTGKSSFIRYLIGEDYPGLRIAAEPTTENFVCITYGKNQIIPGNTVILDERLPFKSLSQMESSFFFYGANNANVQKNIYNKPQKFAPRNPFRSFSCGDL